MIRALRIAVSVVSGISCVLVIALWVATHQIVGGLILNCGGGRVEFFSEHGQIRVFVSSAGLAGAPLLQLLTFSPMPDGIGEWYFQRGRQTTMVVFPHRLPIAVLALIAAAPWIPWAGRFSLRTLLIATTAVALLLAVVTYATRG